MKKIKTKSELEQIANGLLIFSASWCGPCKMMAPVLEQVSESPEFDSISFIKVDTETQPELAQEFGIKSIPTIAFIKNGNIVAQTSGVLSKPNLETNLRNLIK
jgi:thioredoxin